MRKRRYYSEKWQRTRPVEAKQIIHQSHPGNGNSPETQIQNHNLAF